MDDRRTQHLKGDWPLRQALGVHSHDPGLLVAEAAHILGCSESTVMRMVRSGELVHWHIGADRSRRGPIRISQASVYAAREARKVWGKNEPSTGESDQLNDQDTTPTNHESALKKLKKLGIV